MTTLVKPRCELHAGDALPWLAAMPDESVDAIITDPPYSSGGSTHSAKTQAPSKKYVNSDRYAEFVGDNRDTRSWAYWCHLWLSEAHRIAKPGARLMMFSDWRQLPTASDVLQAAGWLWRGIVTWDKTEGSRAPHTGYFRHQGEFVLWATKGPCGKVDGGPFAGVYRCSVKAREKQHMTAKPPELMDHLLGPLAPGSVIVDPFAGSGTTGLAALSKGCHFLGAEMVPAYYDIMTERLKAFT